MNHSAWCVIVLSLVSCIASANTTKSQPPGAARSATPEATSKASDGATLGQCYALDAAARHECIYAAIVRSRALKSEALN